MTTATQDSKSNGSTKVATTAENNALNNLRDLLVRSKNQIALAVPKHLTPDRLVRVALTAFHRTPQLQKCAPLSILGCVIQAAELGLELSGPLGQAYMVPRYNKKINGHEACFQVGYRGLIDLAMRSGRVDSMPLRIVYTNDLFEYAYGTRQYIRHVPSDDGPPAIQDVSLTYPDNVRAVYCVLNLKGTKHPDFEVMTTMQVEAHRQRFAPDSYKGFSPWLTNWDAMAMKTPCRKLAKRAPVSVEFQQAAILDEYAEAGVSQALSMDIAGPGAIEAGEGTPRLPNRAAEVLGKAGRKSVDVPPAEVGAQDGQGQDGETEQLSGGDAPPEASDPPAERSEEQSRLEMDIRDYVASMEPRIAEADRSVQIDRLKGEIASATWLPDGVKAGLSNRCDARNQELAPAVKAAQQGAKKARTI